MLWLTGHKMCQRQCQTCWYWVAKVISVVAVSSQTAKGQSRVVVIVVGEVLGADGIDPPVVSTLHILISASIFIVTHITTISRSFLLVFHAV
jgi:hypothetical protein